MLSATEWTSNLWDRQNRLNVVFLNLEFRYKFFAMFFMRLNCFRWEILRLRAVVNIANRPNNSRSIPMFFGVVCDFQNPWKNFRDSDEEIKWNLEALESSFNSYLLPLRSSCCREVLSGSWSFLNAVTRATVCLGFSFSTETFHSSDDACAPRIRIPPFTRALKNNLKQRIKFVYQMKLDEQLICRLCAIIR